jgi:DNA-binding NarL/FixJ family response regulator
MRILVIDDHPLFRAGLRALLYELDTQIGVVEAGSLQEVAAIAMAGAEFDLVLLDMGLPDGSGLVALHSVKQAFEAAPVVIMSAATDPRLMREVIDAGASGYIPKTTQPEVTVSALRLVLAHGIYLPLDILMQNDGGRPAQQPVNLPGLSPKQLAVLQRLLQGKPNKVIARELAIAEGTVKAHLASVYQFLDVSSRSEAMRRAHELGYFERFGALAAS